MVVVIWFVLIVFTVLTTLFIILLRRNKVVGRLRTRLLDEEYEYLEKRYGQYIRPADMFLRYKDLADYGVMVIYFWVPLTKFIPTKSLDDYYRGVEGQIKLEGLGGLLNGSL